MAYHCRLKIKVDFFNFIAYTKSKRRKKFKPCNKTGQFLKQGCIFSLIKGTHKQISTPVNNNLKNI
jgi:hypothetical protein